MDGAANTTLMRTAETESRILDLLQEHGVILRSQGEQLAAILKALTPPPQEGPTTSEMLQAIIALLGEHTTLLQDNNGHILALPASLPGLVAREIRRGQRLGDLAE
ncbi:hypothetical protein RGI145_23685 (plasmid) [Roseomonas gilardii]|uniref:Uncharacterized protein n=1 Tax=Roseomonas gilardii TaxID=257708 RepID=A0A1L7ANK3_9PROT|nr:hypothetical protein [Roseomonas gilardii]APT60332.1 hypothetical protein RGI145_23685 [Roseomonas gilardii]